MCDSHFKVHEQTQSANPYGAVCVPCPERAEGGANIQKYYLSDIDVRLTPGYNKRLCVCLIRCNDMRLSFGPVTRCLVLVASRHVSRHPLIIQASATAQQMQIVKITATLSCTA